MTIVTEAFDSAAFRKVLGCFPTGVVVVAATVDGRPEGLAVNSFSSVSLAPPLVSFCAAASSSTWPRLRRADGWAITVLSRDQEDSCRTFASKGVDRFASVAWWSSPGGHPVLDGALAWLEVLPHAVHEAGDHELVLCRVTALGAATEDRPLVFFRGAFTGLDMPATVPARHPGDTRGLDAESPFFGVLAARLEAGSTPR
jgi:3-hydroxy-9,10-secoandrosta-1,3,5(10)-triene-9,17-dione monooxygenase reductase component